MFPGRMNKNVQTVRPSTNINFNKIVALFGIGWLTSLVVVRYVIKPWRVEKSMKENEKMMNFLYEEQIKQENITEKYEI